jgi:hypothetical protein
VYRASRERKTLSPEMTDLLQKPELCLIGDEDDEEEEERELLI